jgi:hypothetical protein
VDSPSGTGLALLFWIVALLSVVACAVFQRFRLAAFGMAFFLVGHAMESTIIPLEIYFEHRNYLPSFGIVFGLVAGANQLQARWPFLKGWVALLALLFIGRNLVSLSSQAVVWSDARLVHMEAVNHHPQSERALLSLAQVYAQDGYLDASLSLVEEANKLVGRQGASAQVLATLLHCIAGRPLPPDALSARHLSNSQIAEPYFGDHVYHVAKLVIDGHCPGDSGIQFADAMERWLVTGEDTARASPQIYGSLLLLENALERYGRAFRYAELMTRKNPEDVMALQFTLYLSHVLDREAQGESARRKLVELKERGELSRQEAENLDLFLRDGQ